jgi:SAM-dependent methyltransferase
MDIRKHNRIAWDRQVDCGNEWTVPVSETVVTAAKQGRWKIVLTPTKPVPRKWFPELMGLDVLCLASGGGQQAPILAAAGAHVTVLDNSPKQLEQDRFVAERDSLTITTVEGGMADLSAFPAGGFGLIVHPVSNSFVPDVRPVWKEAFRVLRPGGILLSGFPNPVRYLFDDELADRTGVLEVKHRLPYSEATDLPEEEKVRYAKEGLPLEFSHTLEDQLGGQLQAGLVITDLYEDFYGEEAKDTLTKYMPTFIATRAVRP